MPQTEFYSPFFHIPGRYEWCRIHCASHGSIDVFIVIETATHEPVTVYVNSQAGADFMASRYPESRCLRVPDECLRITSPASGLLSEGLRTEGVLELPRPTVSKGPVRRARMVFEAGPQATPEEKHYGNPFFTVWGSRWSCTGVDLEVKARVTGVLVREDTEEIFDKTPGIICLGSYGDIRKTAKESE